MQYIGGLIPMDQEIVQTEPYPYVYRSAYQVHARPVRRGVLACLMLLSGFFLLLWGGNAGSLKQGGLGFQSEMESLANMPISAVAARGGYSPIEAAQLLADYGLDITGCEQTMGEIAEENSRNIEDILAVLAGESDSQVVIN
nr:hypothetical protein [uncultured Desulfobulbus sp.]